MATEISSMTTKIVRYVSAPLPGLLEAPGIVKYVSSFPNMFNPLCF